MKRLNFSTSPARVDEGKVTPAGRLAKVIAKSDLGVSRRQAERLIEERRVWHNGEVISAPGVVVSEGDVVKVNGKAITFFGAKSTQVYVAHKLPGELVTESDPHGRPTLKERLKRGVGLRKLMGQLCFVGRLDFNSEGLILLTNDGDLARRLEHPSSNLQRTYRVRVHGTVPAWKLAALGRGMSVDGVRYKPMTALLEASTPSQLKAAAERARAVAAGKFGKKKAAEAAAAAGKGGSSVRGEGSEGGGGGGRRRSTNSWLRITCHEGKNRQIRKVCKALGLDVSRLIRVSFGPYTLAGCDRGALLKVDSKKALAALEGAEKEAPARVK